MIRRIAQFSVNRPATVIILIAAITIIGAMSVAQMRTDLMPDMDLPYAAVITSYQGAGPEEIEELVSKPIENMVATVSDIDTLISQSSSNSSMVFIGFNYGTNMDTAMADIRDKISMAESYLPEDAGKPQVMKLNFNMMPVIVVTIGSDELSLAQLQTIAEDDIEPRLSRISGVASVSSIGGLEREVRVAVDPVKAQNYGLSLTQIGTFLAAENYNMSSGEISYGDRKYFVRSLQQFETVDNVGEVAITTSNGSKIQLKEIADITETYKEVTQINRVNGKPVVGLLVQKATDGNTVEACSSVKEEMEKIKENLGDKVEVRYVMDQSDYINKSIRSTGKTLLEGAVLAVLIIFLFMRNLRSTGIVGIAIPLSLVATFIVLFYTGSTLNIITLGGLALGVGRMIDDSIVVFENIYRHRSAGLSAKEAALKGTSQVGGAVLASTLTLIAVFLPIGLAEGISGVLFRPLTLTICVAIACSLLVSLAVVPFMSSRMLTDKAMEIKAGKSLVSRKFHEMGEWLDGLGEVYKKWLSWALGHRGLVIFSVIGLIALSLVGIYFVGAEFMPTSDSGQIDITIEADKGSKLENVDKIAKIAEQRILEHPAVDFAYVSVGTSSQMTMSNAASNKAAFSAQLLPKGQREGVQQVAEEMRQSLKDLPGVKTTVSVSSSMSMDSGSAIEIKIQGDDLDTLRALSKQVKNIVEKVPGTRNVTSSLEDGSPEVQVRINRQRAMDLGLTPAQVSNEIKTAIDGTVVTYYRLAGEEIDVQVTSSKNGASDMDTLKQLQVLDSKGNTIPLSEVASFELSTGPVQINREDQTRLGTISCDLSNRDLNSVTNDIKAGITAGVTLPSGYTIDYGGQNEQMVEAFSSLLLALLMAIMLVYVVMVVQYDSFRDPFVIMFSLPGAIIGIVLALLVTGKTFSVTAFIGIIMLVGIAVANAIVYVDYLKQMLAEGMERTAALLETGRVRLRPILMTALATILAMIPLAIGLGEGSETNAPLAIVVIGGLLAATFVTLFLIPVVYSLLDDWTLKRKNKKVLKAEGKALAN